MALRWREVPRGARVSACHTHPLPGLNYIFQMPSDLDYASMVSKFSLAPELISSHQRDHPFYFQLTYRNLSEVTQLNLIIQNPTARRQEGWPRVGLPGAGPWGPGPRSSVRPHHRPCSETPRCTAALAGRAAHPYPGGLPPCPFSEGLHQRRPSVPRAGALPDPSLIHPGAPLTWTRCKTPTPGSPPATLPPLHDRCGLLLPSPCWRGSRFSPPDLSTSHPDTEPGAMEAPGTTYGPRWM